MSYIKNWLLESNHWKHIVGGFLVALPTLNPINAIYASAVAAGCLEYKDFANGAVWDWQDFMATCFGGSLAALLYAFI